MGQRLAPCDDGTSVHAKARRTARLRSTRLSRSLRRPPRCSARMETHFRVMACPAPKRYGPSHSPAHDRSPNGCCSVRCGCSCRCDHAVSPTPRPPVCTAAAVTASATGRPTLCTVTTPPRPPRASAPGSRAQPPTGWSVRCVLWPRRFSSRSCTARGAPFSLHSFQPCTRPSPAVEGAVDFVCYVSTRPQWLRREALSPFARAYCRTKRSN